MKPSRLRPLTKSICIGGALLGDLSVALTQDTGRVEKLEQENRDLRRRLEALEAAAQKEGVLPGNDAAKTLHRIDKALVIKEVTGAGFSLVKEGNMLRKPEDTRDFNVNKERNKDDRFVLAFRKS